jgi:hypothetical protein
MRKEAFKAGKVMVTGLKAVCLVIQTIYNKKFARKLIF